MLSRELALSCVVPVGGLMLLPPLAHATVEHYLTLPIQVSAIEQPSANFTVSPAFRPV